VTTLGLNYGGATMTLRAFCSRLRNSRFFKVLVASSVAALVAWVGLVGVAGIDSAQAQGTTGLPPGCSGSPGSLTCTIPGVGTGTCNFSGSASQGTLTCTAPGVQGTVVCNSNASSTGATLTCTVPGIGTIKETINFATGALTVSDQCGTVTTTLSALQTGNVSALFAPLICSRQFQAALASVARAASQAGMTVVQSQITSIRDEIQRRRSAATGGPLGYAADPWPGDEQALGYAASKSSRVRENPLYAKAQPAAPKANEYGLAVWGQGFGDYEERTGTFNGTDIGRITRTWGFIGGIDKTFTNLNTASDALVLGLLSGDVTAGVDTKIGSAARITGPSVGVYGIYVNGGFATDLTFKADFFGVDQMQAGSSTTSLGLDNYTVAFNLNYKSDLNRSWWLEPTVGTLHTNTAWNGTAHDLGLTDGDTWRVQGGARLGWNTVWNTVQVDSTLAALAYDDVSIRGGTISTVAAPLVPTDEGKVFGQLIGKLNFDYGNGLSSYLEGEVRGREGVFGAAGRVGLRYKF